MRSTLHQTEHILPNDPKQDCFWRNSQLVFPRQGKNNYNVSDKYPEYFSYQNIQDYKKKNTEK